MLGKSLAIYRRGDAQLIFGSSPWLLGEPLLVVFGDQNALSSRDGAKALDRPRLARGLLDLW